ncbi:MAG: hypothetical protein K8J31_24260 [Anaerolineae bacterium]|nr:hypothetical protein [Anaerolineae bacterium]
MKRSLILLLFSLMLAVFPALAQDEADKTVRFNDIQFAFSPALGTSVNVQQVPGDPVADAGPGFSDAAKIQFTLYDVGEPTDSLFDTGGVRVYRMADIAAYDFLQPIADRLQSLLAERPDLAQFEPTLEESVVSGLPYMPLMTHGQTMAARARYIDTDAVQGISYVTVFRADVGPFTNQDFLYTFQGITTDGQSCVTVTFPLRTDLFPEPQGFDMAKFQAELPAYLAESTARLNAAAPEDFTPALDAADALVRSIQIDSQS